MSIIDRDDPNHHPTLYLLGLENTGWRRWIFGRWAYSSEPFRNDIARHALRCELQILRAPHQRFIGEDEQA